VIRIPIAPAPPETRRNNGPATLGWHNFTSTESWIGEQRVSQPVHRRSVDRLPANNSTCPTEDGKTTFRLVSKRRPAGNSESVFASSRESSQITPG